MQLLFILFTCACTTSRHMENHGLDAESSYFISTIDQLSETKDDISIFMKVLLLCCYTGSCYCVPGLLHLLWTMQNYHRCKYSSVYISLYYDLRVKTLNLVSMIPTAQVYINLVYKEIKKKSYNMLIFFWLYLCTLSICSIWNWTLNFLMFTAKYLQTWQQTIEGPSHAYSCSRSPNFLP